MGAVSPGSGRREGGGREVVEGERGVEAQPTALHSSLEISAPLLALSLLVLCATTCSALLVLYYLLCTTLDSLAT